MCDTAPDVHCGDRPWGASVRAHSLYWCAYPRTLGTNLQKYWRVIAAFAKFNVIQHERNRPAKTFFFFLGGGAKGYLYKFY